MSTSRESCVGIIKSAIDRQRRSIQGKRFVDIRCQCPSCDAKFKLDEQYAGRRVRCPKCRETVEVRNIPPKPGSASDSTTGSKPQVAKPLTEKPAPADTASGVSPMEARPEIDTGLSPQSSSSSQGDAGGGSSILASRRRSKASKKATWIVGGSAVGGIAVLLLIIFTVAYWPDSKKTTPSSKRSSQKQTMLVIDWPRSQRSGAAVYIDGKRKKLPASGKVQFKLEPGRHELLIKRRGYEQIEDTVSLQRGKHYPYQPFWSEIELAQFPDPSEIVNTIPGYENWLQNLGRAKVKASEDGKDILLAFICSDADEKSIELRDEVFLYNEFAQLAEKYFVTVVVDYPEGGEAYEHLEDAAHNEMLENDYNISSISDLPTVVLTDADGRAYAYQKGIEVDRQGYLKQLEKLRGQRQQRDQKFQLVESAMGEKQLDVAAEVVEWLNEHKILRFYGEQYRSWIAFAEKHDPENAKGQYEVLFEADWRVRAYNAKRNNEGNLSQILAELDRWSATHKFQDPNRGAGAHLLAARWYYGMEKYEKAAKHVATGAAYKPTDEALLAELKVASNFLNGVVGTGTGFVVGNKGYILTNHHVIQGPSKIVVLLPGSDEQIPAKLVAQDEKRDMALLKIDLGGKKPIKPMQISISEVRRGSRVGAFGYPVTDRVGKGLKLTIGIVSGLPKGSDNDMIVLDVRVNPGNSGGPLCNTQGNVVGMVTAKSAGGGLVDSYGMAVPAEWLQSFLKKHLPGYKPEKPSDDSEKMEWDEIDQQVSNSVLLILRIGR